MLPTSQPHLTSHPATCSELVHWESSSEQGRQQQAPPFKHVLRKPRQLMGQCGIPNCSSDILKHWFRVQSLIYIQFGHVYGSEECVQLCSCVTESGWGVRIVTPIPVMVTCTCDMHMNLGQSHGLMGKWRAGFRVLEMFSFIQTNNLKFSEQN